MKAEGIGPLNKNVDELIDDGEEIIKSSYQSLCRKPGAHFRRPNSRIKDNDQLWICDHQLANNPGDR